MLKIYKMKDNEPKGFANGHNFVISNFIKKCKKGVLRNMNFSCTVSSCFPTKVCLFLSPNSPC